MIEDFSMTDPKWRLVQAHHNMRVEKLQAALVKATDPVEIYRLQGAIKELENLIAPPDGV